MFVTGASGFIALHCITELLKAGFSVKGSLRNMDRKIEVERSVSNETSIDNLELCKLDLLKDEGWHHNLSDCDYLMHLASPFTLSPPDNENELITPAKEGPLRALEAANFNSLKKVVLISSMAAVAYGSQSKNIYTNDDWSDPSLEIGAYRKSKTIAEKAAWDFINSQEIKSMGMTSILPGFVLGPPLSPDLDGASAQIIKNIIAGKITSLPEYLSVVDVRDVAQILVRSINLENSTGKRILTTSPNSVHISAIAKILDDNKIKVDGLSHLSNGTKIGGYNTDISETLSIFDWKQTPLEQTVVDMGIAIEGLLNSS